MGVGRKKRQPAAAAGEVQEESAMATGTTMSSRIVTGTRDLMILTVFQRGVTFLLNQLLLRETDPEVYGVATIQLELFFSVGLFLSRETIRLALLRTQLFQEETQTKMNRKQWLSDFQMFVNMSCIPFSIAFFFQIGTFLFWPPSLKGLDGDERTFALYGLAMMIECAAEPFYVLMQNTMLFGIRARTEGIATFARAFVTYVLLAKYRWGILSFGISQVVYSLVILLFYAVYTRGSLAEDGPLARYQLGMRHFLPGNTKANHFLDWSLFGLTRALLLQSALKLSMTEGDRITLTAMSSRYDQGVYGLASNYGSLAARIIFQPLEEIGRTAFAKSFPAMSDVAEAKPKDMSSVSTGIHMLQSTLKLVTYIGIFFACFGSNYTLLLIHVVLGSKWSDTEAPRVLSWYCLYVLLMAINGMTEAFTQAVSREWEVTGMSIFMAIITGVHLRLSALLIDVLGTTGLVLANCVNMAFRIAFSVVFFLYYFSRLKTKTNDATAFSFASCRPHGGVILASAILWAVMFSASFVLDLVPHFLLGVACFLIELGVIYRLDRDFLRTVWHTLRPTHTHTVT